jgi:DNA-binding response OmpR family regulator
MRKKILKALNNGRRQILVVDDEPNILSILKEFMELERYKVTTALNAEEGLSLLRQQNFHAVVTDLMLPGMNGLEFMERVKKRYGHIPVVLITGYAGQFTPDHAIEQGADGYFKKPFNNKELIRTLEAILQKYKRFIVPDKITEKTRTVSTD